MKLTSTLVLALVATFFLSCSGNEKSTTGTQQPNNLVTPAAPSQPQPATSTAVAGAVKHYICPNNCEGSGGDAAGNCPVCGTQYAHNAAFHNQPGQAAPAQQPAPIFQPGQAPAQAVTPPQNTSPAQNAAGVFHYTCPSGCAGGSGSAGNCSNCGAQLAHNQAYHN